MFRLFHSFVVTLTPVLVALSFVPVQSPAQPPSQTLLLRDGTDLTGQLVGADDRGITFRERDGDIRHFRFEEVQSINFHRGGEQREGAPPPPPPPPGPAAYPNAGPRPHAMVIPAGAEIAIRTNENIDSRDASESRSYSAEVSRDVAGTNGGIVIPRGSMAWLVIRRVRDN